MRSLYRFMTAAAFLFVAAAGGVFGYTDPELDPVSYKGNFFVELEPAGPFDLEEYDEQAAIEQLLVEAQYVFSGMIYGFEFEYIPMDSSRGVAEEFALRPIHSIPWGDPGLSVSAGKYENGRYVAELRYDLADYQKPWEASWNTNILPGITATGAGSVYDGFDGKKAAIEDSVRESLRSYLRPRIYDKPRRISGRARLAGVPYITIDEGLYHCKAKITLQIEEILEYRAY
ncbi:MAG: hypothetical protein PQJ61_05820 [Spirochaetales bacterium]|uniref:Uncharacterized protein n=1 Tax=Candidatus Thalassospirochaeta sargassi TaxID=3119039 RepID=A0AAJ1MJ47_9SPIO|nr:hypothetical protein [Spirochaetales bacterium]